jgi:uncharacterized protein (DUF1330 family)
MAAYGVGILQDVDMGPEIVEYLERIDGTLAPYDGHFIVHGDPPEMLEGEDPGALIVIEFPDRDHALDWYRSDAYRQILPLRTEHSRSTVFVIDGVDREHAATDVLGREAGAGSG